LNVIRSANQHSLAWLAWTAVTATLVLALASILGRAGWTRFKWASCLPWDEIDFIVSGCIIAILLWRLSERGQAALQKRQDDLLARQTNLMNEILEFKPTPPIDTMRDFLAQFERILADLNAKPETDLREYGLQCVFNTPFPGSVLDFQAATSISERARRFKADVIRLATRGVHIEILCPWREDLKKLYFVVQKVSHDTDDDQLTNNADTYAEWILKECKELTEESNNIKVRYLTTPPSFNFILRGKRATQDPDLVLIADEAVYGFIPTLYYNVEIARRREADNEAARVFGFTSQGTRVLKFSSETFEYLRAVSRDTP